MEISILDLITEIHRLTGEKSGLEIGALEYRPTEIWRMFAANKRAGELLDWTPKTDFSDGLGETVEWYRAYLETFTSSAAPLRHLCGLASD